jgi:hypothetical protein
MLHNRLLSGDGAIGQLVTDVPSELILTPIYELKENFNYWIMHPVARVSDRQRLQHTHQNLHTTDRAKKPIINT